MEKYFFEKFFKFFEDNFQLLKYFKMNNKRKIIIREGHDFKTRVYEVLKPQGEEWYSKGRKYNIEGLLVLIKNTRGINFIIENEEIKNDLKKYEEWKKQKKEDFLRKYSRVYSKIKRTFI